VSSLEQTDRSALRRIAQGAVHTIGSTFVGRLVNWVAVIVLTRELTPEDIGHVALAAAILGIVVGARNFGLHLALIRQYDRVDELAPTHFVINTAMSTIGTLTAGAIAYFYVLPENGQAVAASLSVFALFDLLRGTAQTAETKLRRDLEFTALAHMHAISLVLAAAGGIALVYMGAGYWALVFSHAVFGVGYVSLYALQIWR
jgi:O-antigen/teichoic acid export membrane protein